MSGDTVNKVPLSAVQEKSTSKDKETDEIDLDGFNDSNFVVRGSEETESIEIVFTHPEDASDTSISELRDQLRDLQKKDIQDVTHEVDGKKGRIAIENINIAESSDVRNLREVTIQGKFLPWPKHYTSNRPTLYEILDSSISAILSIDEALNFDLSVDSGLFEIVNETKGNLSRKNSLSSFDFQSRLAFSGYGYEYGDSYGEGSEPILKFKKILTKNQNFELESLGDVSSKQSISTTGNFVLESEGTGNFILSLNSQTELENKNSGKIATKKSLSSSVNPAFVFVDNGQEYGKGYGEEYGDNGYAQNYGSNYGQGEEPILNIK